MKVQEFEQHYKHLKKHVDGLMISKAGEYADDADRIANFKQTTSLLNTNQLKVAITYWLKHVGSIVKIADDMDKGIYPTPELLEEKCGDLAAYSFLMYACGIEELETHGKMCPATAQEAIEILPLDRGEQKDLEQIAPVKNPLDNLNLRTNL